MWAVWKYTLKVMANVHDFEMPEGAELLHFAKQGDNLCVWARVKRSIGCDVPKRTRRLYLVGTGHDVTNPGKDDLVYVGTLQDGPFVWHLFDAGEL